MVQSNKSFKYDLEERTAKFTSEIISFVGDMKINRSNVYLVDQLTRSSASIGANYAEANGASSRRDFKNKIHICKKESKESEYWLRAIAHANPKQVNACRRLWRKNHEFTLIFSKIISSMNKKRD